MGKLKPIYHDDIVQGSTEWDQIRLGKFTASDFHIMLGKSQTKTDKLWEIIAERLTGDTDKENVSTFAMERGKILENEARKYYAIQNEVEVGETGFVEPAEMKYRGWIGCSPDGLVGKDGMIEVKSPLGKNFLQWTDCGKEVTYIRPEYKTQVQFNLMIAERKWCDFIYYHPRFGIVTTRIEPDKEYIEKILVALDDCIAFVTEKMNG